MDKYKTSTLGQALKKVYRGEMSIKESVALAEEEIKCVFANEGRSNPPETDDDTGFYGDRIGKCPLCGGQVVRGRYGYGCLNYKLGCKFKISGVICKRVISKSNAMLLLNNGRSAKIQGFTSKNGKLFDAVLKLENGEIKFDF